MADVSDMDLIRGYADRKSDAIFAELVCRHINLVYSVALRFTGNAADAQDVTQTVFIILVQKVTNLRRRTTLTGWLYETTRLVSRQCLRTRARQQSRDQAYIQFNLNDLDPDNVWEQLVPLLEEGMTHLSETERLLLALRFFENKSTQETAALLGIREWTTYKRVERAVEKLRKFFARRGVVLTASSLTTAISANAVQAAPTGLAVTISSVIFSGGSITTSAVIAATKSITMTTLQKALVIVTVGVLATAAVYQTHQAAQLRKRDFALQEAQALLSEQNRQLQDDRDDATNRLAVLLAKDLQVTPNPDQNELLKLRGEVAKLKEDLSKWDRLDAAQNSAAGSIRPIAPFTLANRASRIEQYLEVHPEERIPELQYAGMVQWLNSVLTPVESDDDIPQALFKLRNQAESRFMTHYLRPAASQFAEANNGQFPSNLSQLENYLDPTVENVVNENYEIVPASTVTDPTAHVTGDWIFKRKTNVNPSSTIWLATYGGGQAEWNNVWYSSDPQN